MKKILIITLLLLGSCGFQTATKTGADIQAQLDSIAGRRFGDTIVLEQGVWEITEPLRINNREGVTIIGAGNSLSGTVLKCNTPGHACIEIIGSDNVILQNINITGVDMAVGVMTGRSGDSLNSSRIIVRDVYIYGQYDFAGWYDVSSESNRFENVHANAQNPDAESVVTVASNNVYGVPTSVELSEGVGGGMLISQSFLTGKSISTLKVYDGAPVKVVDSYIYNAQKTNIELIGSGKSASLVVDGGGFEGASEAVIRLTAGGSNIFSVKIDAGLGGGADYGIYADDDTTLKDSVIGNTGLLPLRFWWLMHVDLSNWGAYDSRSRVIGAVKCFAVRVRLGQHDQFNCNTKIGVVVENQSSLWNPTMDYYGFME